MQLTITAESSLKSIQHAFSELYPFLNMEFIKRGDPVKWEKLNPDKRLGELRPGLQSVQLSLDHQVSVAQLELNFLELLGLPVKIFRRSGTVWVETLHTEHWTLEQQNEEGRLFSTPD